MDTTKFMMQPIDSKQLHQVGYDPETKKMRIQFKNWKGDVGRTYEYDNVEPEDHAALMGAKDGPHKSIGKHFNNTFRVNAERWPYRVIPGDKKP